MLIFRLFLAYTVDERVFLRQTAKANIQERLTRVPVALRLDLPLLDADVCEELVEQLKLQGNSQGGK